MGFRFLIINNGLFDGGSQFGDLLLNGLELFGAEGGGKLNEGHDGVLATDTV